MATSVQAFQQHGLPFDPVAAAELRRQRNAQQAAQARAEHKEALRAYGRKLDEQAREAKRRRNAQIRQCYRERYSEDPS